MDDVRLGNTRAKMETVQDVIQRGGLTRKLVQQVFKKVKEFHVLTGGEHGDLHGDNIMVIKSGGRTRIKIIDYGSFRKYSELSRLGMPFKHVNGMDIFRFSQGQLYLRNRNRLRQLFN
jgi:tRNA A-37 threonylcarbamoyl transferase component Bud32